VVAPLSLDRGLGHSFGSCDIPKRSGNTSCVIWRFLEPGIEVGSNFLGRPKVLCNIVRGGLGLRGDLGLLKGLNCLIAANRGKVLENSERGFPASR